MQGSTQVDFAGTHAEAKKYVDENQAKFPRGITLGRGKGEMAPNGCYLIYARWSGNPQRQVVQAEFIKLGWPPEAQHVFRYKQSS